MYAYSVAEPIAWKVTKGGRSEDPHNGIFKFFQRSGTPEADIRKIISKAGGEVTVQGPFTLGFEHYVNNNPDRFRKEDGRTAYRNWGKFTLQSEEIAVTDPHDSIAIRSRWE